MQERWLCVAIVTLVLAAPGCCSKRNNRKHRAHFRHPDGLANSLWQLRMAGGGPSLYRSRASIVLSTTFLSLFEIQHADDCSSFFSPEVQQDLVVPSRMSLEASQAAIRPSVQSSKPCSTLIETSSGGVLAVAHIRNMSASCEGHWCFGRLVALRPRLAWRRLHRHRKPSRFVPPPPPPPPPVSRSGGQTFWLNWRAGGRVELWLNAEGTTYVSSGSANSVMAAGAGTSHEYSQAPPALFELKRVGPLHHTEATPRFRRAGAAHAFSKRMSTSAIHVGGRQVVVATAHNLDRVGHTPLFWRWLEESGFLQFVLLSTDQVTCNTTRTLNAGSKLSVDCISPDELPHSSMSSRVPFEMPQPDADVQTWDTAANRASTRHLKRWKIRLIEALLKLRFDVAFLDVSVIVLSPSFLPELARRTMESLVISSDSQVGYRDTSAADYSFVVASHWQDSFPRIRDSYDCLPISRMYLPYVSDWISAEQLYMRPSAASKWFIKEVGRYMDHFSLTDTDAIQVILTGHTQVSDPLHLPRAGGAPTSSVWIKPVWMEAENEPFEDRPLAVQKWLRPLNGVLQPAVWRELQQEQREYGFTWQRLEQRHHLSLPEGVVKQWPRLLGRGLGSYRFDGTRQGELLSVEANCHLREFLTDHIHIGSFLLRPETEQVTWQKFCEDFPAEARAKASSRPCPSRFNDAEETGQHYNMSHASSVS